MAVPTQAKTAQRRAPVPVAPPPLAPTELADIGGRNLYWQIEQAEDGTYNLILLVSLAPSVVASAPKSKVVDGKGGNPVLSSSAGFKFLKDIIPGKDLGINFNLICKDSR